MQISQPTLAPPHPAAFAKRQTLISSEAEAANSKLHFDFARNYHGHYKE